MMAEGNPGAMYVFCSSRGTPLWRTNVRRESFHPILKRAGCPIVGLHALRYASATLLRSAGANPKIVQERLGHSSIAMTMDVYSHSIVGIDKAAAGTFDALLANQKRLAVTESAR
jgi:integrase